VVATPDQNHFCIVREALEAGNHVFVEKPLALSLAQAEELVSLAEARDKILMTGHIMQYHWAVRWIKERIETGCIHPRSVLATRVEFGIARADTDLLWSSAIHDVSVIQYLLGKEPRKIDAAEASISDEGMRDILFITMTFDGGVIVHIYAGFAGPYRERKLIIHAMQEIVSFDGLSESLNLLTRKSSLDNVQSHKREYGRQFDGAHRMEIQETEEPLLVECQHFLDCIKTNKTPLSGGRNSLAVIRTLDRIERALGHQK
jgi:predicted dehydrogenase